MKVMRRNLHKTKRIARFTAILDLITTPHEQTLLSVVGSIKLLQKYASFADVDGGDSP